MIYSIRLESNNDIVITIDEYNVPDIFVYFWARKYDATYGFEQDFRGDLGWSLFYVANSDDVYPITSVAPSSFVDKFKPFSILITPFGYNDDRTPNGHIYTNALIFGQYNVPNLRKISDSEYNIQIEAVGDFDRPGHDVDTIELWGIETGREGSDNGWYKIFSGKYDENFSPYFNKVLIWGYVSVTVIAVGKVGDREIFTGKQGGYGEVPQLRWVV